MRLQSVIQNVMSIGFVSFVRCKIPIAKSRFFPYLFLLFLPVCISSGPTTDYCTIKCRYERHTVCKRRNQCGPVKGCTPIEPTVEFRQFMVKEHNELRNKIASGADGSQYSNKGAKNMNAVSYDMEMEYIAQCWANLCHTLEHDTCRNSKRYFILLHIFISI